MGSTTLPSHGRELPGKHARIRPGKYLVYHFTAKDSVRCTPDGDMLDGFNEMGHVFEDLAAARQYCRWKVEQTPKLGCVIYDHQWKALEQFTNAQYIGQLKRAQSPQRQLLKGIVFLILGSVLIWLDARQNLMLIIGVLIGLRLAVGGVVHIALSILNWRQGSAE